MRLPSQRRKRAAFVRSNRGARFRVTTIIHDYEPMTERIKGILSPVLTPFQRDYSPDAERFTSHCRWLLANDVSLAVFGTNSEANSLSGHERADLLERLVDAGIDPRRLMPGTGCCSLTETVRLTSQAVKLGCTGVLMLPPFYYKGVTDEGLYRSFAETIERVGDKRLRIYLYHIPPVAQVGISLDLIERLLKSYPEAIAGMKDSSGDWNNTKAVLDRFSKSGFDVFVGSETFLLANMRNGGKGAISATANVNPAKIAALYREWNSSDAVAMQGRLDAVRTIFGKYPMIAAMKRAVAHWRNDEDWSRVRPPMVEIAPRESTKLIEELKTAGFDMPGIDYTFEAA
jgi:4-hydroxy-tetrahydrodipicolinate synthase